MLCGKPNSADVSFGEYMFTVHDIVAFKRFVNLSSGLVTYISGTCLRLSFESAPLLFQPTDGSFQKGVFFLREREMHFSSSCNVFGFHAACDVTQVLTVAGV